MSEDLKNGLYGINSKMIHRAISNNGCPVLYIEINPEDTCQWYKNNTLLPDTQPLIELSSTDPTGNYFAIIHTNKGEIQFSVLLTVAMK